MAKRIFTTGGVNFTATAAGSQATSAGYMALFGGAATQLTDVLEIMISGMATASTVTGFQFVRASTIHTGGLTALASPNSDAGMNPSITALGSTVGAFIASATNQSIPSATTTDARINLALNAFGGIVRWNAAPTQQWTIVGNAAPGGESVLYNSTTAGGSTALANAHIIYETT